MRHQARQVWRWQNWRVWPLALAVFIFASPLAPAAARAPAAPPTVWPEVLTLNEAARFLRLEADNLETLALRKAIPARRIAGLWRFNRNALLAWLNGDWSLITTAVPNGVAPLAANVTRQVAGSGTKRPRLDPQIATNDSGPNEPIGEAPKEPTADEVFLRDQRVLLAPGKMTVDLGLFYTESANQQLVSVDGGVGLATKETKTATTQLLGRYGLFDETEIFASTALRYKQDDVIFGAQKLSNTSRAEFSDVRLGLRRTLLHERLGAPDVIATLDAHIPIGDTSYALGGGLALVKSIDPAVLFANANYRHTFSRDFADVTRLEPRHRVDVTLGYALALNDTLTLSTRLSGLFTAETEFNNATLHQQELFSLQFGLTSWLAEGLYIEPTISFGLNGPGDSFAFGVTIPYTF